MTKILLVEDNKSLREIYGVRLLAEGYDIVSAGDGEEALAMAIKERPALILSDVMMPKISGFDMLDILRSATETKDIKVIIMTALSSNEGRARGEQLGADRYLVKTQAGIEDVVRAVHEVLGDAPTTVPTTPQAPAQPAAPTAPQTQMPPVANPSPQPTMTPPASANTAPAAPAQPATPPLPPVARQATLGDRVIQPLEDISLTPNEDVARLMEEELEGVPHLDIPDKIEAPTEQQKPADPEALVLPPSPPSPAEPAADTPDIAPASENAPDVMSYQPTPPAVSVDDVAPKPLETPTLPTPPSVPPTPPSIPPIPSVAPTVPLPQPQLSQIPSKPPTNSTTPPATPPTPPVTLNTQNIPTSPKIEMPTTPKTEMSTSTQNDE